MADLQQLNLSPRHFRTQFGGLFLFLPYLAPIPWEAVFEQNGFPGSAMIPATHAIQALLCLKLYSSARHSQVMSEVFDPGLALFAGLNSIPERSFLTEYSSRIVPAAYPKAMREWFDALQKLGLPRGESFDLDFCTIPFHGEDALLEKHYVSKRNRRQKGLLAFVAQDADTHAFCCGNAQVRKENQNDEVLRFVTFWKERTGQLPRELIFDSKLTTYGNLAKLPAQGIHFFHIDALSSAVPMKVDCDLQLTLMGSSLYRLFANEIGQGYERAKSRTLFRDFTDTHAAVDVGDKEIMVRFQKRAHNPLLLKAEFDKKQPAIPWRGNRKLNLLFG